MKRLFSGSRLLPVAILALLSIAPSCEEETTDPDDRAFLHIAGGNGQTERVGAWALDDLVVSVRDILGAPLAGRVVTFSCDAAGAELSRETAVSDAAGIASTRFRFGSATGAQAVAASIEGDEVVFTLTAVAIGCAEASLESADAWTPGHVFIATPSSTLLPGAGSAVIEYDPAGGSVDLVARTDEILTDLCFSARGDLYVAGATGIWRIDPATGDLLAHGAPPFQQPCDIEPNFGGVLVGIVQDDLFSMGCPGAEPASLYGMSTQLDPEFLLVHQATRAIYAFAPYSSGHFIYRFAWDGLDGGPLEQEFVESIYGDAPAKANGACIDDDATIYVVMDSNDSERYLSRMTAASLDDEKIFDFYVRDIAAGDTPGRWGEIACSGDTLWLVDTQNDRLVWLEAGPEETTWGGSVENTAFSRPGTSGERYGIAVAPAP